MACKNGTFSEQSLWMGGWKPEIGLLGPLNLYSPVDRIWGIWDLIIENPKPHSIY